MRCFLLARVAHMRRMGMIEGLAIDVLSMLGQVSLDRGRQIGIKCVWHTLILLLFCLQKRRGTITDR